MAELPKNPEDLSREELISALIENLKISHPWLLESVYHKENELKEGNFSPELQHAISVQELLGMI